MINIRTITLQPNERFDVASLKRSGAVDPHVVEVASQIIADVREKGDEHIKELALRFDGVELDSLRVSQDEIDAAVGKVDCDVIEALLHAKAQIEDFHQRELPNSWFTTRDDGTILGQKVTPLECVGIYVPGGRAQYPSTVLMNAIPARVAGVKRVVMCTPAQEDEKISDITLAAASLAGVDEVYATGGAQAIAAMAYGTQSIPRVDKITGPGNAYVAAAKKLVSGDVGIDMIAGPSEVCVLADASCSPKIAAIDLMAQAEHDPMASSYLVTTSATFAKDVQASIDELLLQSPREEITKESLASQGLIVICNDMSQAEKVVDCIAPEHLELQVDDAFAVAARIKHAGAIFVGPWTSESLGDYVAGPNHTLPTSGTAVFSGPLSVDDFIKKSSIVAYTAQGMVHDAKSAQALATAEGLWSHAKSLEIREALLNDDNGVRIKESE